MNKSQIPKNTFFDINKFPAGWGKLFFPISMVRADNAQSAQNIYDSLITFISKIREPKVAVDVVYADLLYLYNDEKSASEWKFYFSNIINRHFKSFKNLLSKNKMAIAIPEAIEFRMWGDLYAQYNSDFTNDFLTLKKLYSKDSLLQKYVLEDTQHMSRVLSENQINFVLEESMLFTSLMFFHSRLFNRFAENRESWFLMCYPGKPLKTHIYLVQTNLLNFKTETPNPLLGVYNLEEKKFYDFNHIDLETYAL